MISEDVTITRVEAATLEGTRPRLVGRNARLDVHGRHTRDRIVRLHTRAGVVGWGTSGADEEQARRLVGRTLDETFDPETGTRDPFLAFDFPLWDLAGRVLGQPVHAMLSDAGVEAVPVYDGSIYFDDLDPETGRDLGLGPVLDAVTLGLEAGFRGFKAKIGRGHKWMEPDAGFRRDVEVVHAVRDAIGQDAKLLVDANNGYSPDQARELMRQAGDAAIHWFEEPFPEDGDDGRAFRQFLREGGWAALLADGEGSRRREAAFTEIVRAGGVDVVQFDMRLYSLTRWRRYLPVLDETDTLAAPHNWGSHLACFYIAQFGRGCPRFAMAEIDPMHMPCVDSRGYLLVDGALRVPDSPGFGLELDASALRAGLAWTVEAG